MESKPPSSPPKDTKLISNSSLKPKINSFSQFATKTDNKQKTMPSFYKSYFNDTKSEFRIEDYLYKPSAESNLNENKKDISNSLSDVKHIQSQAGKEKNTERYFKKETTPSEANRSKAESQVEIRSKSSIEYNDLKKKQRVSQVRRDG